MTPNVEVLLPFFNLVPVSLRDITFVAGSCVLDPMLATDIDMWILPNMVHGENQLGIADIRERLTAHFIANGLDRPVVDFTDTDYDDSLVGFKVVANIDVGRKIQIMVGAHLTVRELLETFDITFSQAALTMFGTIVYGNEVSEVHGVPAVIPANASDKITRKLTSRTTDRHKRLVNRFDLRRIMGNGQA